MYCCHKKFGGVESIANVTRANTGGVEELRYMATRHETKERIVACTVAVTRAGGILNAVRAEDAC